MNVKINTPTAQPMTASEIENLASHIIALKGNYDFTGTNLTVTPPADMSPRMAGIIVKCAQKNGGTVNINGATEISDDEWNICKQYGAPLWMIKAHDDYGISIGNLITAYGEHPEYKTIIENGGLATPRIASDATDIERKWMIRSAYGYDGWNTLTNILQQTDWQYLLGGFSPTSNYVSKVGTTTFGAGTLVKFFSASAIPSSYKMSFGDNVEIYVNGVQIFSSSSYHSDVRTYTYDFSNVIKLHDINVIVVKWYGSGNHGFDFGFVG